MNSLIPATVKDQETYSLVSKAITFIRQHYLEQPSLATVAQHVNLSEYHFQRLFTQWAGISPKRFAKYLTLDYAKSKITETNNLIELALDSGLSGPGRLHDLFVTVEAMSPGEYKAAGAGLEIRYGLYDSFLGTCLIAVTDRGVCNLLFLETDSNPTAKWQLQTEWPNATVVYDQQATEAVYKTIFETPGQSPLALHIKGTNFQIQVWKALLKIPFGGLTSYQGLANMIGKPTAARAIGNAAGRNPVGYLIPCHRVIRGSGELGGYRWGLRRKTALMGWEAGQCEKHSGEPTGETL